MPWSLLFFSLCCLRSCTFLFFKSIFCYLCISIFFFLPVLLAPPGYEMTAYNTVRYTVLYCAVIPHHTKYLAELVSMDGTVQCVKKGEETQVGKQGNYVLLFSSLTLSATICAVLFCFFLIITTTTIVCFSVTYFSLPSTASLPLSSSMPVITARWKVRRQARHDRFAKKGGKSVVGRTF